MAGILKRLLIVDDQPDFARRIVAIAERLGFTTRLLQHTLDFEYVMGNWHPHVVAIQMDISDQQEIGVLEYLERTKFQGRLLMTGDVKREDLEQAARVARQSGFKVAMTLAKTASDNEVEAALKLLVERERAA